MRLIPIIALLCLSASPAGAQQFTLEKPIGGMKHMSVAPAQPAPVTAAPAPVQPQPAAEPVPAVPVRNILSVEQALRKPDELKTWSQMSAVVTLSNKDDTDKMVRTVEADPGSVPPQALFFLAQALADQNRMSDAALYYYVAELRNSFDQARWPASLDPVDVKRLQTEDKKSPDQRGHVAGPSVARLQDPHSDVSAMSTTIGARVSRWMFSDPVRAEATMLRVKEWDLAAPYAYKPNGELPEAVPFEKWGTLLSTTREAYYLRMSEFLTGLKKLKAPVQ